MRLSIHSPKDQANIDENQENSDEPMELANFVNNSTPTPIRISRLPKMSIHEELLDEEKENIGPNSKNEKPQDDNSKVIESFLAVVIFFKRIKYIIPR